jgi:hypothetical protein
VKDIPVQKRPARLNYTIRWKVSCGMCSRTELLLRLLPTGVIREERGSGMSVRLGLGDAAGDSGSSPVAARPMVGRGGLAGRGAAEARFS